MSMENPPKNPDFNSVFNPDALKHSNQDGEHPLSNWQRLLSCVQVNVQKRRGCYEGTFISTGFYENFRMERLNKNNTWMEDQYHIE